MNNISQLVSNIKIVDACQSWEESIRISAKELVDDNSIKQEYVNEIIKSVNKNGPYFIVMDLVALPHCSKLELVNKTAISILKLNQEVIFPDDKPVKLLITLAAKAGNEHMKLLSDLTELLMDDEKMEVIINSKQVEEISKVVESV
jgi:PTS system mannitol-specific IIA component/PTS system ascorbate-specific IIA component